MPRWLTGRDCDSGEGACYNSMVRRLRRSICARVLGHVDAQRLAVDQHYGLKLFFFTWAFERAGAPRAYRIAAVKAVSSLKSFQGELPKLFKKFCRGKDNRGRNPVLDPGIAELDVRGIMQMVRQGALGEAFQKLKLEGMGHKIETS